MTATEAELEKLRQQFDKAPYPRTPLDLSPRGDWNVLYLHNMVTAYYLRNQQVVQPEGKVILDAGCGTGYKSLILAEANPGAKIVGLDLSEESVKLARERLKYHQFENVEFYAMPMEDLPQLGMEFDYINNDETLYLIPDPIAGLKAMQAVLKPGGIIRTNFHSALQRVVYLRVQEFFRHMGLMDGPPEDAHLQLVRETMRSLKDMVFIKSMAWKPIFEQDDERLLANYLLQGDKGWTIPEFFAALREAHLDFISMTNWRQWNLLDLFRDLEEVPISLAIGLSEKSLEEQLHLYELLHPIYRLLDLWCGHPGDSQPYLPVSEWGDDQWQQAKIYFHPQFATNPQARTDMLNSVSQYQSFEFSRYLRPSDQTMVVESLIAGCLLPLLDGPQSIEVMVKRLLQLRPIQPVTLEPTDPQEAFELIKQTLIALENGGYILAEQP